MVSASFEEKSVWIQLVATVVALAAYAVIAASMYARGVELLSAYSGVLWAAVVVMIVILVVGHILAAATGEQEKRDERDRAISWRSESNSAWVLGVGVLGALACMVGSMPELLTAHVLLLSLFASQLMYYGFQILYYRRGM